MNLFTLWQYKMFMLYLFGFYWKYDNAADLSQISGNTFTGKRKQEKKEKWKINQNKMSSAAMENFVMNVRTLSTQGNFNELNEFLQKNMELLVRNPAHLGTVLETLDFQQHSLGVLAVMSAKLQVKISLKWLFNLGVSENWKRKI